MHYDFDKVIDRSSTGALKLDVLPERYGRSDLIPLWVADMDFETPPCIIDALKERLCHPVLGYTVEPKDYRAVIIDWIYNRHKWRVNPDWISYIPGVVKGIGMVIDYFTKPGDKILIQPPVYHPFRLVPEGNSRIVLNNPLRRIPDGKYEMDLDNLAQVIKSEKPKILILSNPHNPGGIAWNEETLRRVADICKENGVLVISDEIHSDLMLWGTRHVPFATVSETASDISITFGAPTKTFNIAGVVSSYAIIPNQSIRDSFYSWLKANEFNDPGLFPPIATIAAFTKGEDWRIQLIDYIEKNIEFVESYLNEKIPSIRPLRPQASYLVWLDCRALGLNQDELNDLFINKAQLALNDGAMFGPGGEGYMRMNVASPRSILKKALDRLYAIL